MSGNKQIHLFIGRFQPFHAGHFSVVREILENPKNHLLIGIGSSQESGTERNPFSYKERITIIERKLQEHNLRNYQFFPIPDINNPEKWAEHVLKLCKVQPQFLHTGADEVKHCFQISQAKNKPQIIHIDRSKIPISATQIRKNLLQQKLEEE